jgi:hypothetical protein
MRGGDKEGKTKMAMYAVIFQKTFAGGIKGGFALLMAQDGAEATNVIKRIPGVLPNSVQAKDFSHDKVLMVFEEGSVMSWPDPTASEQAIESLSDKK